MSAPSMSTPTAVTPPEARARGAWSRWLREPLLHFMLLGAALFALDHAVNGNANDERVIVIDEAVDKEALKVFKEARGRAPSQDEL